MNKIACIVFPLFLFLVGCGSTPTARWAAARESLTVATSALNDVHSLGKLSDKQVVAADAFVKAARAGLNSAETYLPDGGNAFDHYMDAINTMILKLYDYQLLTKKGSD